MARPTSFRLPEELLERLEDDARTSGASVTSLVAMLLDEGLKTRHYPGIVYRDGAMGRRAGIVGGPDVWEVVRDLRHGRGRGMARLAAVAQELGLPAARVQLAADFYATFPDEIDAMIEIDDATARRVRALVERRERLLTS